MLVSAEMPVRQFLIFILTVAVICSLSCTKRNKESLSTKKNHSLRWLVAERPETFDWTFCKKLLCLRQAALVMEGLTQIERGELGITAVPVLAKSWTMPSAQKIVFKLKENVYWSNGQKLEAKHFVQAWRRLLSHAATNPYASLFFPVVNARLFSEGKLPFESVGIETPDPFTLVVHLRAPSPNFPWVVSHPATWPVWEVLPAGSASTVTLGPFRRLSFGVAQDLYTYFRNPTYHAKVASLEEIVVSVVPSPILRAQIFLNGEADLVDEVPSYQNAQLTGLPSLLHVETPHLVALIFNVSKRPFNERDTRLAFEQSIEHDEAVTLMKWSHAPTSRIFPNVLFPSSANWSPRFAPVAAKEALGSAVLGSKPVMAFGPTDTLAEVAENLRAQWIKNLGVDLEMLPLDERGQLPPISTLAPSLYVVEMKWDLLRSLAGFEGFANQLLRDLSHWKDPEFDALLREIENASDMLTLSTYLNTAQETLVAKENIVLPLFFRTKAVLRRENIHNLVQNPIEIWDFRDTTMD